MPSPVTDIVSAGRSADTKLGPHAAPAANLTQKAFLNAMSFFLDYGCRVLVSLLVTPLLIANLGSALFGVWQILIRLIGFVAVTDGRPTEALKWTIANLQGSNDVGAKRRAVGMAFRIWLMLLPLLIIAGSVLVWLSPLLTNAPDGTTRIVRATSFLLMINLIATILTGVPEAVLRGMNLGYKRMGVVAGLNIVTGALAVIMMSLGLGLPGIAGAYLCVTILSGLIFTLLVRKNVPWFGIVWPGASEVRNFLSLSIWYTLWGLVNKLLIGSDVVILGWCLAASAVTDYVSTGYVAQNLVSVGTLTVAAAVPGLGGFLGAKQYTKALELCREIHWLSLLIATALGSSLLLWNRSFVGLWIGAEHYLGDWPNLLFVLIAVQLLFIKNESYFLDVSLNVRTKVMWGLLASLASIILALLLVPRAGIVGLCLSIFLGRSVLTIVYPTLSGALLDLPLRSHYASLIRPIAAMGVIFWISFSMGRLLAVDSWSMLVPASISSAVLSCYVQYRLGFALSQRQAIRSRLSNLKLANRRSTS